MPQYQWIPFFTQSTWIDHYFYINVLINPQSILNDSLSLPHLLLNRSHLPLNRWPHFQLVFIVIHLNFLISTTLTLWECCLLRTQHSILVLHTIIIVSQFPLQAYSEYETIFSKHFTTSSTYIHEPNPP